jgi:hypothetical protein
VHDVCVAACDIEMERGRTRQASNRSKGVAGFVQVAPGKYSDEDI